MIKLFSISFSFVILIQSIGLCFSDFTQIDELIEHAQFHSKEYGDNFFTFIAKHYGQSKAEHNKVHEEEKEDHEQLPFQHHSHMASINAFVLNHTKNDFKTPEVLEFRTHNFFYQEPSSSFNQEGLFQPPRQL